MIRLCNGSLEIELCQPRTFYQGTRFDACGVFRLIRKGGYTFADRWYTYDDPTRHDNVCGTSEEFFGVYGYDKAAPGETFMKIGVGLLVKENHDPYDWFHTYKIYDPGEISVDVCAYKAVFTHNLKGKYIYSKEIELVGEDMFVIRHHLENISEELLRIDNYCHNFFTFDSVPTGKTRRIDFPATPSGHWREDSVNARLEGDSLVFDDELKQGQKAYIGDLKLDPAPKAYSFILREGERAVHVSCDAPLDHMVMWACAKVACPEPYVHFDIAPGKYSDWTTSYRLI